MGFDGVSLLCEEARSQVRRVAKGVALGVLTVARSKLGWEVA